MFIFIILPSLFVVIHSQCYLADPTDATKCYLCSYGYTQISTLALTTQCVVSSQAVSTSTVPYKIHSTTTCTTDCDGTDSKPFPDLISALKAIPYPQVTQTTPQTYSLLLMDELNYIKEQATDAENIINRRKFVSIIISKDASLLNTPKIVLKTQKVSIYVSGSITLNDIIFEGLGLNEKPSSTGITCTSALQGSLFNSDTGISGTGGSLRCGVRNFTVSAPTQSTFYGLFTIESIFEKSESYIPRVTLNKCQINNIYLVDISANSIINSFIYLSLNLPGIVELSQVNITNSFFSSGFISNDHYSDKSDIYSIIQSVDTVKNTYLAFQKLGATQITFSNVIVQNYNDYDVKNIDGSNSAMLIYYIDSAIRIQLSDSQILNTIQNDMVYDTQNGQSVIMRQGTTIGHQNIFYYQNFIVYEDSSNKLIYSQLIINNLYLSQVKINVLAIFNAQTTLAHYNDLTEQNNQLTIRNMTFRNVWLYKTIHFCNVDFDVSLLDFQSFGYNAIFYSDAFNQKYNYFQYAKIQNSKFIDLDGLYVDDNVNELNVLLRLVNRTIKYDYFPATVLYNNIIFQNVNELVVYDSNQFYEAYVKFYNIQMIKTLNIQTAWQSYGGWTVESYEIVNLTMVGRCEFEQIFNLKTMPKSVTVDNVNVRWISAISFFQFKTSIRFQDDFTFSVNKFIMYYDITTNEILDKTQTFFKDDTDSSAPVRSKIGTFKLTNSDILIPLINFDNFGFFQMKQPYHIIIQNTIIFQFGQQLFYFISSNYQTQVIEEMQIINSTIKRQKHYNSTFPTPLPQNYQTQYMKVDELMSISTHKITFYNSTFQEMGTGFAYYTLNSPYTTSITKCTFFNFGLKFTQPSDQIVIDEVEMGHNVRNSTSFFIQIDGIVTPSFVGTLPPSTMTAPIIITNSQFKGNLSSGQIQLTRSKAIVQNCKFTCVDLWLQSNPASSDLSTVDSLIILKQYAWLYFIDSAMDQCSSLISQKRYCIAAYSTSTIEIYDSTFTNSSGANGGFLYGYGMSGIIKSTTFTDGQAQNGGAIYGTDSVIWIISCQFEATNTKYSGGHIYMDTSNLTINETSFKDSIVVDAGGSIYGRNMVYLSIKTSNFTNITQNSAVIYLTSQERVSVSWYQNQFSNCKATQEVIGYLYNQDASLILTTIENSINIGNTFMLIENSEINMNTVIVKNSQFNWLIQSTNTNTTLTNCSYVNSFFQSGLYSFIASTLTINTMNISYMEAKDIMPLIKSVNQFSSSSTTKSLLIYLVNSTLYLQELTLQLLTLVSISEEYQGQLLEVVRAIQSKNSKLYIYQTTFEDVFIEIGETLPKRRLLFQTSLLSYQAKVIDSISDSIIMSNVTLPDFAIKNPMVSFSSTTFDCTNITNQFLSLLPQSLMQNYCNNNTCEFIDFRFNSSKGTIKSSSIKSFGVSFYLYSGYATLENTVVRSRDTTAQSKAFYALNTTLTLTSTIAQAFNDRSIFYNTVLTMTGGRFSNSKGIAIYGGQTTINNALFTLNKNDIGGAFISECSSDTTATITISNTNFTNNSATTSGGALRNIDCNLNVASSNLFENNTSPYGQDMLGYPAKVIIQQVIQLTDQSNIASISNTQAQQLITNYKEENQIIYVLGGIQCAFTLTLVDNFNQIFPVGSYFDSASFVSIYQYNETTNTIQFTINDSSVQIKLNSYYFDLLNNVIMVTEMYFYAKDNYKPTEYVQVLFNGNLIGKFTLIMLQCPQGSLSTSDRCFLCPTDTYSLSPSNEKCDNCADNQICYGKNYLFASPGFYIPPNTSEPIACPVTEACSQNVITAAEMDKIYLIRFYEVQVTNDYTQLSKLLSSSDLQLNTQIQRINCADGYEGQLCVYCAKDYGQTSDGVCYQCQQDSTIYIRFAISTFIILALNYKDSVEPLEEIDPLDPILSNVLFRILTDFTQLTNTIIGMSTNVSPDILPVFGILADQISIFPSDFDSGLACLFLTGIEDSVTRYKYRLLIGAIIPWLYLIIMIGLILLIDKIKQWLKEDGIPNKVSILDIIIVCLVASFYNFYMYLTDNALSIFSCLTINDYQQGEKVVLNQMTDIQCWEKQHLELIFIYGLPTIVLYVLGIPLLFIFFVQKYFQKSQNLNNSFIIGKISQQEQQSFKSNNDQEQQQQRQQQQQEPQEESSNSHFSSNLSQMNNEINYSIFLTRHLKDKYKYWGIYIQIKKLLITIIIVISITIDINTASIIVLIVFILFMLISYKYSPYKEPELNRFEAQSDLITTVIIHLTLLLIQTQSKSIQIFASIMIVGFKYYFYFVIFKIIANEYLQYFRKKAKQMARSKTAANPNK